MKRHALASLAVRHLTRLYLRYLATVKRRFEMHFSISG